MAIINYTYTPDEPSSLRRMIDPNTCIFKHTVGFPEGYALLFDKAMSSSDLDELALNYMDANAYLIDESALLSPIYVQYAALAQKPWVHNTGSGLDGEAQIRFAQPELWWMQEH